MISIIAAQNRLRATKNKIATSSNIHDNDRLWFFKSNVSKQIPQMLLPSCDYMLVVINNYQCFVTKPSFKSAIPKPQQSWFNYHKLP